ncbi:carotenoid oxygenase family protein, partial [Streptomyces nanshensis]
MTTRSDGFDPTRVAHLGGRFAPVGEEVDETGLRVEGELPPELDGVYLRNGPNPRFTPIGSYLYPIDGDGMLHSVRLSEGGARYRNRFVRTPALRAEEAAGPGPRPAGTAQDVAPDAGVTRRGQAGADGPRTAASRAPR